MTNTITKKDAQDLIRYVEYLEQIVEAEGYSVGAEFQKADDAYEKLMKIADGE